MTGELPSIKLCNFYLLFLRPTWCYGTAFHVSIDSPGTSSYVSFFSFRSSHETLQSSRCIHPTISRITPTPAMFPDIRASCGFLVAGSQKSIGFFFGFWYRSPGLLPKHNSSPDEAKGVWWGGRGGSPNFAVLAKTTAGIVWTFTQNRPLIPR